MKKRISIIFFIIILFVMGFFLFLIPFKKSYTIDKKSEAKVEMNISPEIVYYAVNTPDGEWIISGLDDINDITTKLSIVTNSYSYDGNFDYDIMLSGVNSVGIVQGIFLIDGKYIENGGRIIELDFNLESYLRKMIKHYENKHSE